MPVRKIGYGVFGVVMYAAYLFPGSSVKATFAALAAAAGNVAPFALFRRYVKGFLRGMNRIEQVRHGYTDAIDAMLEIPEKDRLDALLSKGGVVMAIPHAHASLAMGRGLGRHYPLLALVRSTANERRAKSEWEIYENLGCDFVDIRLESPTKVARKVLAVLNKGGLVVGTVDRIREAPPADAPINSAADIVRAEAFGEPIGITGWPARFTAKAGAVIVPSMIVQSESGISLRLGNAVTPGDDLVESTQDWVNELERLFRTYPDEWTFALDKHWSRVLRQSAKD
jgi:KDO2-lipid IV(A) lauroyltransferase